MSAATARITGIDLDDVKDWTLTPGVVITAEETADGVTVLARFDTESFEDAQAQVDEWDLGGGTVDELIVTHDDLKLGSLDDGSVRDWKQTAKPAPVVPDKPPRWASTS